MWLFMPCVLACCISALPTILVVFFSFYFEMFKAECIHTTCIVDLRLSSVVEESPFADLLHSFERKKNLSQVIFKAAVNSQGGVLLKKAQVRAAELFSSSVLTSKADFYLLLPSHLWPCV